MAILLGLVSAYLIIVSTLNIKNNKKKKLKQTPCPECQGSGQVTYDQNHYMTKINPENMGTHLCPMCGGEKILYEYD